MALVTPCFAGGRGPRSPPGPVTQNMVGSVRHGEVSSRTLLNPPGPNWGSPRSLLRTSPDPNI